MAKSLVLYFSKTGSNKYLAERIAHELNADIEPIRPGLNNMFSILMSNLVKFPGIHPLKNDISSYDSVVVCGPIWMGSLLFPMKKVLEKVKKSNAKVSFATCCGSSEAEKDDRFGYEKVFKTVENVVGSPVQCEVFPIKLVIPEELQKDDKTIMNTRLNDENFTGKILERLNSFMDKIKAA